MLLTQPHLILMIFLYVMKIINFALIRIRPKLCSSNLVIWTSSLMVHNLIKLTPGPILGVDADDNLTWELHVRNLCKLTAFLVHSLTRLRHTINRKLLDLLYKTPIQPCFDYACSVWGNYSVTGRKALLLSLIILTSLTVRVKTSLNNYPGKP